MIHSRSHAAHGSHEPEAGHSEDQWAGKILNCFLSQHGQKKKFFSCQALKGASEIVAHEGNKNLFMLYLTWQVFLSLSLQAEM